MTTNRLRHWFALLPALPIALVISTLLPHSVRAQDSAVVSVDRANVRSGATASSQVVGSLARGTLVAVIDSTPGWLQVRSSAASGWVASRLVTRKVSSAPRSTTAPVEAAPREEPRQAPPSQPAVAHPAAVPAKPTSSPAAATTTAGFVEGGKYLGARVWAGVYGSLAFGGQFEYGLTPPRPDLGNGRFGVSAAVDMYSYGAFSGIVNYRVIPISGLVNYHVTLDDKRIDPFVGLGLGYYIVSVSVDGSDGYRGARASTLFVSGQLGARYFFKPNLAAQVQTGFGLGAAAVGLTWKM